MPIYEYRCERCEATFELRRPIGEAGAEAACPAGHPGARRRLSVFASPGAAPPSAPAGGCGAGCACAAGRA